MRDLHFDGGFLRDFNAASKQWSWAVWHEARAAEEATATRLLEEVFGEGDAWAQPGERKDDVEE
ncbi:MAG TPA: hypothetical protein VF725_06635 [Ktedonobacterales bacterium]